MSKEIPLTQGRVAIVDDADFDWLNQWSWCYCNSGYAIRSDYSTGTRRFILMHRLIMDAPKGMCVDHLNHDGLDNRRENIRIATPSQNLYNSRPTNSSTSSKYKGVFYVKDKQKWGARINYDKTCCFLGYFDSELEAAQSYNSAAIRFHGEFALPNNLDNHVEQELPVKRKRKQSSIYKGVSLDSRRNVWCSYIMINYKKRSLGQFGTDIEAAKARDAFVRENGLEHKLNFPG